MKEKYVKPTVEILSFYTEAIANGEGLEDEWTGENTSGVWDGVVG